MLSIVKICKSSPIQRIIAMVKAGGENAAFSTISSMGIAIPPHYLAAIHFVIMAVKGTIAGVNHGSVITEVQIVAPADLVSLEDRYDYLSQKIIAFMQSHGVSVEKGSLNRVILDVMSKSSDEIKQNALKKLSGLEKKALGLSDGNSQNI